MDTGKYLGRVVLFQGGNVCSCAPGGGQAGYARGSACGDIGDRVSHITEFLFVELVKVQQFRDGFRLVRLVFRSCLDGTEQVLHAEFFKRDHAAFFSLACDQGNQYSSGPQRFYQFTNVLIGFGAFLMHPFINRIKVMKRLLPFFPGNHFDHSLFIQAEGLHNFPFAQHMARVW